MKRYRKLLVGLDLEPDGSRVTDGSRRAALQAQWLAEKTRASITFLHSTHEEHFEQGRVLRKGPPEDGVLDLETLARDCADSGVPTELVYSEDRPWLAMIRRVQRGDADLVFVAKRNEPEVEGRHVGSTSAKLVRKCPAPVWVVKPDHDLVHSLVVAATDLTPVGDLATELGAYAAEAHGCALWVLHAWQTPFALKVPGRSHEELEAREREIRESAERHVAGVLERLGLTTETRIHLVHDAPSRAILDVARRHRPDLVVLGSVSRTWVPGLLVGNTAEKVLARIDSSLLVVKPEEFVSPVPPE